MRAARLFAVLCLAHNFGLAEAKRSWPCNEQGCPASEITCEHLLEVPACHLRFDDVFDHPPAGTAGKDIKGSCNSTCTPVFKYLQRFSQTAPCWSAPASGSAAQPIAADEGPWPCHEAGCPSDQVACVDLSEYCCTTFDQIFSSTPAGLAGVQIAKRCASTCDRIGRAANAYLEWQASQASQCGLLSADYPFLAEPSISPRDVKRPDVDRLQFPSEYPKGKAKRAKEEL